jgi:carnitine O-acetyltransferase
MLLARSINPSAPTLFHAPLSPRAKAYKPPRSSKPFLPNTNTNPTIDTIDTTPKKLEWKLTPELRVGVRYAETRLSALICQNECQALEFDGYYESWDKSGCVCADGVSGGVFWALWWVFYF